MTDQEVMVAQPPQGDERERPDRSLVEQARVRSRNGTRSKTVLTELAIVIKIRDGQVTNRPVYCAIGVTVDRKRDILGLWIGVGGEGAKYWLGVLTELRNRGVEDVCIVVCDGLKGLPEAIETTWPLAVTRTCVLHLIRNTVPSRGAHRLGPPRPRRASGLHRRQRDRRGGAPR